MPKCSVSDPDSIRSVDPYHLLFFSVFGVIVIKTLDPDWIRIGIQPKMLNPDQINTEQKTLPKCGCGFVKADGATYEEMWEKCTHRQKQRIIGPNRQYRKEIQSHVQIKKIPEFVLEIKSLSTINMKLAFIEN
jgi:hypothetical protein